MFVGTRLAMVSLLTSVGIRYYGFSLVELSFILNWLLLWFCECCPFCKLCWPNVVMSCVLLSVVVFHMHVVWFAKYILV